MLIIVCNLWSSVYVFFIAIMDGTESLHVFITDTIYSSFRLSESRVELSDIDDLRFFFAEKLERNKAWS